jgi:hypothetical protein
MHNSSFNYFWDDLAGLLSLFRARVVVVKS